jgi:hypothetical protein
MNLKSVFTSGMPRIFLGVAVLAITRFIRIVDRVGLQSRAAGLVRRRTENDTRHWRVPVCCKTNHFEERGKKGDADLRLSLRNLWSVHRHASYCRSGRGLSLSQVRGYRPAHVGYACAVIDAVNAACRAPSQRACGLLASVWGGVRLRAGYAVRRRMAGGLKINRIKGPMNKG